MRGDGRTDGQTDMKLIFVFFVIFRTRMKINHLTLHANMSYKVAERFEVIRNWC
jgi:hypothetical protein